MYSLVIFWREVVATAAFDTNHVFNVQIDNFICWTWNAHKADCTPERHLFMSTIHQTLTPFIKPCNILNLAVQNIFYVQSCVDFAFSYNLGSTILVSTGNYGARDRLGGLFWQA